jgi:hypothetical protein
VVVQDRFEVAQLRPIPLTAIEDQKLRRCIRELAQRQHNFYAAAEHTKDSLIIRLGGNMQLRAG